MKMRPLALDALPSASITPESGVAFGRTAAAIVGATAQLKGSPFGAATLTCTHVIAPREPDEADVVWALRRIEPTEGFERCGYLLLDGMTALRLVAATLGVPAPEMLRRLGAAERGIVTAAVASAFRSMNADTTVLLGRSKWTGRGLTRLLVRADFAMIEQHGRQPRTSSEQLRLDVPLEWLPAASDVWWLHNQLRTTDLEIPFTIELARTTLRAADWTRARRGDAVVFDEQPSRAEQEEWPGWVRCGDHAAEILIARDGRARMVGAFRPRSLGRPVQERHDAHDTRCGEPMSNESEALSITMLAAAPIELIAEIGRFVLRADEVTALRAGSLLPVGPLRRNIVSLKVGEREWAQGELVDVEGQLGVRLTAIIPAADASANLDEAETLR